MIVRSLFVPLGLVLLLSLSDCVSFANWASDTASERLSPADNEGEDDESDVSTTPTPGVTPTPTATPRSTATPRATATPQANNPATPTPTPTTAEPAIDQGDLDMLLLGLDDLPPGWSVATVSDPPTDIPGVDEAGSVLASAFFQRSELGPYLVHMLLYSESNAASRAAFRAIEAEITSGSVLDNVTDQVRSWETQPIPYTALGNETFAFTAMGDTGIVPVAADIVATRQGKYISFIMHAELMTVDSELTDTLAETAVGRLPVERFNPSPYE